MNKQKTESLLASADILVNGNRPWDIQVLDERMYKKVIAQGSLGLGETYMAGWWDAAALDRFFYRILISALEKNYAITPRDILDYLGVLFANLQNPSKVMAI